MVQPAAATQVPMEPVGDPLAELLINYNELNTSVVDELYQEPSPLEFMRYVSRNTPFVVRGGASTWTATKTWTLGHLKDLLRDQTVNVAVTPNGFVHSHFSLLPYLRQTASCCCPLEPCAGVLIMALLCQARRRSYQEREGRACLCQAVGGRPALL